MKKLCLLLMASLCMLRLTAQGVAEKLRTAVSELENDAQMEAAITGFVVVDQSTGKTVFDKNGSIGLAPASTQKIFTAIASLDQLGPAFRYATTINLYKTGIATGLVEISGTGDPSLGSFRFAATKPEKLLQDWSRRIGDAAKQLKWTTIFLRDQPTGNQVSIPETYTWQDMGNYYGAGSSLVNWNENQYDIQFSTGGPGSGARINSVKPAQSQLVFNNRVNAGATGSGDNAWIFSSPYSREAFVKGTVPPNQKGFTISGSMPDPSFTLGEELFAAMRKSGLQTDSMVLSSRMVAADDVVNKDYEMMHSFKSESPSLDTLVYWFLRKSVNLYGEALLKTIAVKNGKAFETAPGISELNRFWEANGVKASALNVNDGSGLSPQNRVTANALVKALLYASGRSWYAAFFHALPEYNGMKMKSGSIGGARAFAGYHTSKEGKKYAFAILVNNYSGSPASVIRKMYKVLDNLK